MSPGTHINWNNGSQLKTVSPIELVHVIGEILVTLSHFAQLTVEVNKPENSAATRSWLTS